ncbi:MAG: fibronectin type III domain-containing protein [Bacteroidetes bacterium]|nr:fibronectin type III domain-containing protein [Bacteroidota bacterium]
MKKTSLTALFVMGTVLGFAQDKFWTANTDNKSTIITDKAVTRLSYPKEFKLFNLNLDALKQQLFTVVDKNASKASTVITLPDAAGQLESFEVFEASNMEPALQAQFPEIRAFSGRGITDKYATLKLSISPQGIQTSIFRTGKDDEFGEPYSKDHSVYSFYAAHRDVASLPWTCRTEDTQMMSDLNGKGLTPNAAGTSTGQLKTMRLAQSVTAEYSNYFGATSASQVSLVLAAINATLTRCNGVYEKDLAVHLNLIANTTAVIYYNASTDPYSPASTGAGGAWNSQLQSTLTSVIGDANYDIGHLFGASGGGGNAGCIGCVCVNGQKGSGFTSPADGIPMGDNFDIDYVVHEVGHQMGANHTFSMSLEGTGVNKEIGSGITIMGYAGITAQDVAPHSIAYYHEASIAQIQANLAGKTCPVSVTMTTNHPPVIGAVSNYTIPISTPFALTAAATDPENDPLTYSWEQNDNSTTSGANSVASPTKTTGPNFLSFSPTVSPTRLFPQLSTILSGLNVTPVLPGGDAGTNIEALSSVARTLNFRLTVRDNHPYTAGVEAGQTAFTDVVVTVSSASGPFAVTAPNTAVSWAGGSTQTVTWSVNNTTAAPVSCASVNILLSTDGGQTFPYVLASATPNDGTQSVTMPNVQSTTCRVKVEAVGNIFFDISNTNFTLTAAAACGDPTGLNASAITNTTATVGWTAVAIALSYDVDYKLTSTSTWTNAATATTATTVNLSGLTQGTTYDWRVRATCSGGSGNYIAAQFTTTAPCSAPTGLTSSAITSSSATVSWTAVSGATSYAVDYKLNASSIWTSATGSTTATSVNLTGLSAASLYDWRVNATCASGTTAYTAAQFTTTAVNTCPGTYDVSTNGSASGAALIPFNTDIKGLINPVGDNDYYKFVISTSGTATITLSTLPADYDLRVYKSNGTSQLAISQNGGTTNEVITRTYTAGTYYARVYGYSNAFNATNCYTLRIDLGTATREDITYSDKLSVSPNPVGTTANLAFKAKTAGTAQVSIVDQTGAVVSTQNISIVPGNNLKQLDVSKLPNGIYFVKLNTGDKVDIARIVVAK